MRTFGIPYCYLPKPFTIFVPLLLIIFVIEKVITPLLPPVLPVPYGFIRDLVDALFLTLLIAPFIWVLVARPLRMAAMAEISRTKAALDCIMDAVINFDAEGTIESLNPAAGKMFGYAPHEMIGQNITRFIPAIELDGLASQFEGYPGDSGGSYRTGLETAAYRMEGTCFPVGIFVSSLDLEERKSFIAIIHDITGMKSMKDLIKKQKEFAENLVLNNAVPTFVISPERRVLLWNRACEQLTGIKGEDMIGGDESWRAFYDRKRPVLAEIVIDGTMEHTIREYAAFGKSSFIPEGLMAEGWYSNLNGRGRYLFFNAAPVRNSDGELLAVIETLEDITERKLYEKQLEYQANHDELTGLPNRNLLNDRIQQALHFSHRNHYQVAVIFVDLDHFKFINDSLGHNTGDSLVKIVAERLSGCIRSGDTVARHGGDEFVIIITDPAAAEHSAVIADKIQRAVSRPFTVSGHEFVITCSIGISIYPRDGEDAQTLMKNADAAMYRAKDLGRNCFQFYAEEMNSRSLGRMTMENHLRRALERSELSVCYQPKVSLHSGLITGMEALARWTNPELGPVSPAKFIPLAEETGLIEPIGEWVLRTACAQSRACQDGGLPPMKVAVNLSARQMKARDLPGLISRILRETGLDPRCLELEITESMVMHDVDRVTDILNELKGMGINLTMDDFGTGYSSLNYLKRFPFDTLKLDQSFVRDITSNPNSAAIARAVVAMAHSLSLKVIAEGVETAGQLKYLRSLDCDELQGYYFSRPVPGAEFQELLRTGPQLELDSEDDHHAERRVPVVDDEATVGIKHTSSEIYYHPQHSHS
jgi:diguanylate cyclase (GGDEF)-like protein/PAS domain S-box-containing protein